MNFSLSDAEIETLLLSLRVAGVATAVALPLGVLVAWVLAKFRFPGRDLISGIVHLPLVLPPVVTGYALLVLFGVKGPIGALLKPFGIVFAFDWTGAALAAGLMGFPLLVRAARVSFEAVDPGLEQAAATSRRAARAAVLPRSPTCRSRRRQGGRRNGAGLRQGAG